MMQATISGLSQEFSFEDGSTVNSMLLTLPDGVQVRAVISDDAVAHLTVLYVKMGGVVTQETAEPPAARMATSNQPVSDRNFSPIELTEPDDEPTFGGTYEDAGLAAVGQQLRAAEQTIASVVGDTSTIDGAALRRIAGQLRQGTVAPLPQPTWEDTPVAPTRAPALSVGRDAMGNPVLTGPNLVDPHDLSGGHGAEEGDVGQV